VVISGVDGEIVTANEVHLPENTPVIFEVFSEDVIHSFWIPNFGGKIDALPGVEKKNYLYYTTPPVSERGRTEGGDYYQGQCVELCGASHALMRFAAIVHSRDEFIAWASSHNTPPVVETSVEKKGEEVFQRCMACHTIEGTLSASLPGPKIGPNLSNFGNRRILGAGTRANSVQNLRQWINHPETIKPGSLMPGQALNPDELEAVIAYIRTSTIKQF
jgi:cytochrome c oxidase subunit 2